MVAFIWSGPRLHWFFVLLDPHADHEVVVIDWRVEDVRGIPLVVSEGRYTDGSAFFRVDLPGGLDLECGDALGLASQTSVWNRSSEALGLEELQRRLHVMELFTCFTITLGPLDARWDRARTLRGWPSIEVGCSCGEASAGRAGRR